MTPDDLLPHQRRIVLYLWAGLTPKRIAGVCGIALGTVRQVMCDVGKLLPGNTSPLQKILLWKADCQASQQL